MDMPIKTGGISFGVLFSICACQPYPTRTGGWDKLDKVTQITKRTAPARGRVNKQINRCGAGRKQAPIMHDTAKKQRRAPWLRRKSALTVGAAGSDETDKSSPQDPTWCWKNVGASALPRAGPQARPDAAILKLPGTTASM